MMNYISETDLILNADGSAYHINLFPHEVADTIITVGDQDRVAEVSKHFDHIEIKKGKREFVTHTGRIGQKRITVISTGIGTDNIDIVLNELDALVNINLDTRTVNSQLKSLDIIRIGTSGAVQADVELDTLLVSSAAFGLDPLMHYYQHSLSAHDAALLQAFKEAIPASYQLCPYYASAGQALLDTLATDLPRGITITAPGFYTPQGRQVRAQTATPQLLSVLQSFSAGNQRITNLEMETAGIYGLATNLGHQAISFNVILANRVTQQFSKQPLVVMEQSIVQVLERITNSK
ncbi:nucleoside phosphorylase [Mucilaginibacter robiniae]|uniref:Uridine phosphorylase n=1 Tax=Mucilaginibacter robiniae TaxID=2728022 RepID=A0A7L5E4V0_9SPHI|nr:nucleoside phosphorylase [Mucilaginibacter robiniae]QJD97407.1 nucleoside phosphorylase [Mucilaginibacter robiniae]